MLGPEKSLIARIKEKELKHQENLEQTVELLKDIKKVLKTNKITSLESFRNGVLAGLGTVLGATLVLAILIAILQQLITVPLIGAYVKQIVEIVQNK